MFIRNAGITKKGRPEQVSFTPALHSGLFSMDFLYFSLFSPHPFFCLSYSQPFYPMPCFFLPPLAHGDWVCTIGLLITDSGL